MALKRVKDQAQAATQAKRAKVPGHVRGKTRQSFEVGGSNRGHGRVPGSNFSLLGGRRGVTVFCDLSHGESSSFCSVYFPCCNLFPHRDCVDDGVDAMCPFCRIDVRDVLNGGLHVRCPLCEGLVDAQGSGEEAVHVFSCALSREVFGCNDIESQS